MDSFPLSTPSPMMKDKIVKYSSCDYVNPIVPAMADHCTTGDLIEVFEKGLITVKGETR